VDRIFVHTVEGMNLLRKAGIVNNVALFPHGVMNWRADRMETVKRNLGLAGKKVISSYGFLLPQKGIGELIRAFAYVVQRLPDSYLILANALYPHASSEEERIRCLHLIDSLGISDKVTMINQYLKDEESLCLLEASDLIVFPYRGTVESSSAAVRYGLVSQRPVACTPQPIFSDVEDVVHFLPGYSPEKIADGIIFLVEHPEEVRNKWEIQKKWLHEHSWSVLGKRLSNVIHYIYRYD
jgi:glycosyltransferase involved in cell wall biosynthesis